MRFVGAGIGQHIVSLMSMHYWLHISSIEPHAAAHSVLPRQQFGQFVAIDALRLSGANNSDTDATGIAATAGGSQHTLHLQIEGTFPIAFGLAELVRIAKAGRRMESLMDHLTVGSV